MITPEQLIYDLQRQIIRLEEELQQAQLDIKDFEVLAVEWKDGYDKLKIKHQAELGNAQETIEELEKEIAYSVDKEDLGDWKD